MNEIITFKMLETHLGGVFSSHIWTLKKVAVWIYCLGDWLSWVVYYHVA